MENKVDTNVIVDYHAHIYYDPASTRDEAARVRRGIARAFPAALIGSWHDAPVGPHPMAMYQVVFPVADFSHLVPWLMLNRGELAVLVHPNTDDEYADHAHHALWLGAKLPLHLGVLKRKGVG